jgi:hypothetical protein
MKKYILALFLTAAMTIFVSAQNKTADLVKVDDGQSYLVLSTKKIGTMEKELEEAAAKGFRVLYGAPTQQYDMALFLERLKPNESPYSYKIMATMRNKTMEKELNEFASQGYRLLPRTLVFKQGFITAEMVMLMERAPDSGKAYEYKLISAGKETKLHTKIDDAAAEGFAPITMITIGEHVVVMEKETALKQ